MHRINGDGNAFITWHFSAAIIHACSEQRMRPSGIDGRETLSGKWKWSNGGDYRHAKMRLEMAEKGAEGIPSENEANGNERMEQERSVWR